MPKWTEKALNNTLADAHQLMRLNLAEVDPADQNQRVELGSLRTWLDIGFTQTIYVDPQANYGAPDGSIARPYNSLQAAIDAITDASPSKRYLVLVMAGSLTETITMKNCVSVKGVDRTAVKITGNITLSTAIQYCSLSQLGITGNVTINNTGTNAASLELDSLSISGTLDITGRGAGSDAIIIDKCDIITAFNVKGLSTYIFNTVVRGAISILNNGSIANTQGYLTYINFFNTPMLGSVSIESDTSTEKVYVSALGGILSPGTLTLTCNASDVYTVFDSVNYPRGTVTIASGNPTIAKWDEAKYIKADPTECLVGTTVQEQLTELAELICPLPSPSIIPVPSISPSPSPEASPSPSPEVSPSPSPVASISPSPSAQPIQAFDPAYTIFVGKPGSTGVDANTISEGLAQAVALSPASNKPVAVIVYAGEYTEPPLIIPDYVTLTTAGGLGSVVIVAQDVDDIIVTIGSDSEINGFLIQGASGSGGSPIPFSPSGLETAVGILAQNEANTLIRSCIITDCETGIIADDVTGLIVTDVIFNNSPIRPMTDGIIFRNSSIAILQACAFIGTPASKFNDAVFVEDSNLTMASTTIQFAAHGLRIDGVSSVLPSTTLFNYCDVALRLNGTLTLKGNACTITNGTIDIEILSANVEGYFVGTAALTKVTGLDIAPDFFMSIMQSTEGDEGIKLVGELGVGTKERPSESCFGEGDSSVVGEKVFRNTNLEVGTWSDVTDEAVSPSGSTFALFPGTGTGNCFYVGVPDYEFGGIKLESINPAMVLGAGEIICEYWNGAAWVEVNVMETDAGSPYAQRANNILVTATSIHIRFGEMPSWAQKALNGTTAYWFRIRIVTAITSGPTAERCKYHVNRTEINSDGVIEYFGAARQQRQIPLRTMFDLLGYSASQIGVNYAVNTNLSVNNNARGNNARDGSGSIFRIPEGLDTSLPIEFRIKWAPDTAVAGNVEHEVYLGRLFDGLTLDGTNVEDVVRVIAAVAIATQDDIYTDEFEFDIPEALTTDAYIWSHVRDATGGNPDDTLGGAIYIVHATLTGYFWR